MAENLSPILCQAIGDDNPRGLTGCNTKCKTSDRVELENTYEDHVKKRLRKDNNGLTHFCADARLCSSDGLKAAGNIMLCKECVLDDSSKEFIRADKALDKYMTKNSNPAEKVIVDKLLSGFCKHRKKRAARDKEQFIATTVISCVEQTKGIVSEITYQCNAKCGASIPLAQSCNRKSYTNYNSHVSILDYDADIMQIVAPYINGSGQREESLRLSMLDLPSGKNFQRNISRHEALVGKKIQLVCSGLSYAKGNQRNNFV